METERAVKEFRKVLDGPDQWHGKIKFPDNESDTEAHKTCNDARSAEKYCPIRWKSVMKWADVSNVMMLLYRPKNTQHVYDSDLENHIR